jgi:hypothetical protein
VFATVTTLDHLRSIGRVDSTSARLLVPPLPAGVSLQDLPLSQRTANALKRSPVLRALRNRERVTIDDLLGLHGFGWRCVVNYLEHILPISKGVVAIPKGTQTIAALLARCARSGRLHEIVDQRIPPMPAGLQLHELTLRRRTINCLRNAGLDVDLPRLSQMTVRELLLIRAFGIVSLIDLLEAIDRAHWKQPEPTAVPVNRRCSFDDTAFRRARDMLRGKQSAHNISNRDPRFGAALRKLDCSTIESLCVALDAGRDLDGAIIIALAEGIHRAESLTLEAELCDVLEYAVASRNAEITRAYFGFGEASISTLQEIGDKWHLTRERIRQICSPGRLAKFGLMIFMPTLRRVLQQLHEMSPVRADVAQDRLRSQGMIEPGTLVSEILRYARVVGHKVELEDVMAGHQHWVVGQHLSQMLPSMLAAAHRLCLRDGATTAQRVLERSPRATGTKLDVVAIEAVLTGSSQFVRIGDGPAWFISENPSSGLKRRVEPILAEIGPLSCDTLRAALRRDYRLGPLVPPVAILRHSLERIPGLTFNDDVLSVTEASDFNRPRRDDISIVQILRERGGVCARRELQQQASRVGVSEANFWRIANYSPYVKRLARGVYALLGANPAPDRVREAMDHPTSKGGRIDFGWTSAGSLWIAYRLSSASSETGVIGLPASTRALLQGDFEIRSASDGPIIGTARTSGTTLWGLGGVLRSLGAEPGECLVLNFSLPTRKVDVVVGDESLIDRFITD